MNGWMLYAGRPTQGLEDIVAGAKAARVNLDIISPKEIALMHDPERPAVVFRNGAAVAAPDFAVAAFVNEADYYNLAVLRQLEVQGIVCVNRAEILEKTGDKMRTIQLLAPYGIPMPKTILLNNITNTGFVVEQLGLPVVVKILTGSGGKGIVLVSSRKELDNLLHMWSAGGASEELIAQEFIAESKGRDVRVLVIDNKPAACVQRMCQDPEGFKSNISAGGALGGYPMNDTIYALSQKVIAALDLCVGGIDLLISDKHGYVVGEVNSVPGFHGMEKFCDINIPAEMLKCVAGKVAQKKSQGQ
jgi:gamma-F420-2:alpha-L-glutamate ligase